MVEKGALSTNVFASLNYQPTSRFIINLGLNYYSWGELGNYKVQFLNETPMDGYFPDRHYQNNTSPLQPKTVIDTTIQYKNNYQQYSIPLGLGVTIGDNYGIKLMGNISADFISSISNNYPSSTYNRQQPPPHINLPPNSPPTYQPNINDKAYYYFTYLDSKNYSYKKSTFSGSINCDLFVKIHSRFRINLELTGLYGLSNFFNSNDYKYHSYRFYISSGISYKIK